MTITDVVENYKAMLGNWQAAFGPIERPPAGEYNLSLTDVTVQPGEFRYKLDPSDEDQQVAPAFIIVFQWLMDSHPVTGKTMKFPGRFWEFPLLSPEDTAALPANQQKRIEISLSQLKGNAHRLLGYEPDDPIEALRGFGKHVRESFKNDQPIQARVQIRNRKGDPDLFDGERVLRLIETT